MTPYVIWNIYYPDHKHSIMNQLKSQVLYNPTTTSLWLCAAFSDKLLSQRCFIGNLWRDCFVKSTSCILILLWFWCSNMLRAELLIAKPPHNHQNISVAAWLRCVNTSRNEAIFRKSHSIKTVVRLPVSHSQWTAEISILDVSANPLIKLRKRWSGELNSLECNVSLSSSLLQQPPLGAFV